MPPDKKEALPKPDVFAELAWFMLSLYILMYIVNSIIQVITDIITGNIDRNTTAGKIVAYVYDHADWFIYIEFLTIILAVAAIFVIIHVYRELVRLRREERLKLYPDVFKADLSKGDGIVNSHWENVVYHVESENENDWRLAILEADIMLSKLLNDLGLPGDNIAEKLKAVEKSDFLTLENAWEAHKIRNQVAHEGIGFPLNHREAKRVIHLYQTVFEEFQII